MTAALFGIGSFVGSMFGMNLQSTLFSDEYTDSAFNAVTTGTSLFILMALILIVRYFMGGCWARTPFDEPGLLDYDFPERRTSGETLGPRRELPANSM